jgi:hypothetical protein
MSERSLLGVSGEIVVDVLVLVSHKDMGGLDAREGR